MPTNPLPPQPVERLAYSRQELARALGIGLTAIDELIDEGVLPSFQVKRRKLIPASAVAEFQARQLRAASKKRAQ